MSRFEIKIVAALLLIAVIPLAASIVLVGQVVRVSDSVSEGQSRRLARPLERAAEAYRGLFSARKQVFQHQASLLARDSDLLRLAASVATLDGSTPAALVQRLTELARDHREIVELGVLDHAGRAISRYTNPKSLPAAGHRDLTLRRALAGTGYRLEATFRTPGAPFEDFRALGQAQRATTEIASLRGDLAYYYRVAFVIMFGGVLLAATLLGLFIARRTARRVAVLAAATRKVASGDLETRVQLHVRDEMGDLARSFNEMVGQVRESRERIAYLEKIGAWQEIARRLAHEIKNPLTPIQLAVQQLHRRYRGEDAEFAHLLDDARDIITEEIDGLRRLVQDFSAFAKLPSVQAEPVDLNNLIDDFLKSHAELEEQARISWTPIDPPCELLADRMLLKHVLYNLMENAIQAAEEAGTRDRLLIVVAAAVDPARHRLTLSLTDNGPGMAEATRQRAFDPYFTTKEKGTGLGLAIVKKIVLEHNGSIAISSEPEKGSRVDIMLPLAES